VALAAVFVLVTWAVEFATHLHAQRDAQVPGQSSHSCEICAALQAGAAATVVAHDIPALSLAFARHTAVKPCPGLQLVSPYRSRAPPHV
jgi:hypothetical protein